MMGIGLRPLRARRIAVIDIVSKRLLQTALQIWLFILESWIRPVFVKAERLYDLKDENEMSNAVVSC